MTSLLELIPGTMEHKDKRLRELEERLERSSINNVIPECPVRVKSRVLCLYFIVHFLSGVFRNFPEGCPHLHLC